MPPKWDATRLGGEPLSCTVVVDFDEYTFRAPRPGYFLGDCRAPNGDLNPVTLAAPLEGAPIPQCRPIPPYLGVFDRLPFEMTAHILLNLDIFSLIAFRAVNQRAKWTVDSLPEFQAVDAFPKLLASISTLQSRGFDLKTLAACIRNPACRYCGHFGELLYLVTAERWCYKCFRSKRRLMVLLAPVPRAATADTSGVEEELKQRIPHVLVPSSYYGDNEIMSADKALLAFDYRAFRARADSPAWKNPRTGSSLHPCRYMAVIRGPYFDEHTQSFEEGFHCRACAYQGRSHSENPSSGTLGGGPPFRTWGMPWRKYTRDGLRDHLDRFGRILRVKEASGQVRYAHERPFSRRTDMYYYAPELESISDLLRRCRDKEIEWVPLQPFLLRWNEVSTEPRSYLAFRLVR